MKVNREELAWAAGLFDGEGSTCISPKSKGIAVQVPNTDRQLLERFQMAVGGMGKIGGPYVPGKNPNVLSKKNYYKWWVCSLENSQAVIAMLWEFLGEFKRNQAKARLSQVLTLRSLPHRERYDALPKINRLCRRGLHQLSLRKNNETYCSQCQWDRAKARKKELLSV